MQSGHFSQCGAKILYVIQRTNAILLGSSIPDKWLIPFFEDVLTFT